MTNIITDLELLRRYMSEYGASQSICENSLTFFDDAEDVYGWTNEPLNEYYEKNAENKKVLTVTSSGDHLLHAALAGAKDITAFDINRFSKYYAALKVALIKTYTYEDFTKMFNVVDDMYLFLTGRILTSSAEIQSKLPTIFKDCYYCLTREEKAFWQEYFKLYKKNRVPIIKYLNRCHHTNNVYCKKEEYQRLRQNLLECNIKYIDSNIDSLDKKTNETFDIMYISNIIGSIAEEEPKRVFDLIRNLQKRLNKNGVIYDCDMLNDTLMYNLISCNSEELFNEILIEELPDFEVSTEELTRGSIHKFKYKGQSK